MALSGVALPALSSLQGAPDRFVSYYLKFLSILAFLSMPVAAWCFLFADAIIHFYLGPGWYEVTPYFRLFALASFFSPAMLSLDRVPLACGHARQYLYTGVLGGTVKVAGITVGVIGWGPMGAAVSIVVSNLAIWGPYYLIAAKGSPLRAGEYARTLMAPTAVSLAAGSLAWGAVQACGGNRLTVLLVGSAVFWASCVAFYAAVDVSGFWCRNGLVRRAWAWVSARSRTGNGKQP
jgi:O-antigen/teichoic acid export membrane protein